MKIDQQTFWTKNFKVSWIESDLNGKVRLSAIFDYLYETFLAAGRESFQE